MRRQDVAEHKDGRKDEITLNLDAICYGEYGVAREPILSNINEIE